VLYSHSRVACFEQCPLKFKFAYVEKPSLEVPEGIEAFLGTLVHESLQMLYNLQLSGKLLNRERLLEHFCEEWEKRLPADVRVVRRDLEADDYRRVGLRCLALYYDHYHPFDQGVTLSTEQRLTFALGGHDGPDLVAYIDRLVRTAPGVFEIHDYKTSGRLPSREAIETDNQLALYEIALRRTWPAPVKVAELVWHYLRFDTELRCRRTSEQLQKVEHETLKTIASIDKAIDNDLFPPHEGPLCPWCDFRPLCPVFAHEERTAALAGKSFRDDEGVALVDAYSEADKQEKEAKARKEVLRERILKLCSEQQFSRVVGTAHAIAISTSRRGRWPSAQSDPDSYSRLECTLKESGWWDRIAEISPSKVEKLWQREHLPESLRETLTDLRQERELFQLRLSRRGDEER
jgi:putative RecB family exonuclease